MVHFFMRGARGRINTSGLAETVRFPLTSRFSLCSGYVRGAHFVIPSRHTRLGFPVAFDAEEVGLMEQLALAFYEKVRSTDTREAEQQR